MKVTATELPGVLRVEPRVFRDDRGYFLETWSAERYAAAGNPPAFVQDNVSSSRKGVVRGLHFQHPHGQAKLVSVLRGEVFDVAVDVRAGSPTFGRWVGMRLSAESAVQMFIPAGFAHGFAVLSDEALFSYKCTAPYRPDAERTLLWNDPRVGVRWPVDEPLLSGKDLEGASLDELASAGLPRFGGDG
jgi:dTDP-4-dehydrorhamnose 3,5-epimerase